MKKNPPSIEIVQHRVGSGLGSGGGGSISFSKPWREMTPGSGSGHGSSGRSGGREPPEKRLTLFALRLAVLEKAASGLGKLDFAWATVVLLGGFASDLSIIDFWCITVILVSEGARVFSRSHELEWQHHATLTSTAGNALRSSSRFFRRVAHAIAEPQTAAAFGDGSGGDTRARAALFQRQIVALMKQRTWHAPDVPLLPYGLVSLKRFFYDAYSQCIDGSIFDGIKMDLVTFAEELILSDFLDEQLIGIRILQQLATSKGSARDTLRKLGTNPRSIERAVEMLNWKRHDEEEVRKCAAEVVSKLAGKRQNALRVSGIPGAIESVMSLLYTGSGPPTSLEHPLGAVAAAAVPDRIYDYLQFNLLGLHILKKLARDHDNCGKIGNARGLLAKIVEFTHVSPALLLNPSASDSQMRSVKRALQVIKMLVYTTGATGKALRRDVAENVFTVSTPVELRAGKSVPWPALSKSKKGSYTYA